jgi:HK97 family phage portal protein
MEVETRAMPTSGLALPQPWMAEAFGAMPSPSGQRVNVHTAMGLSAVWSAVSYISEQVGQLPLKVYRVEDGDRVEARSHRAWRMLHDKPNEHTPADRFWSAVSAQVLLYGNAFLAKRRDDLGLVEQLVLLNPQHMVVYWDGDQLIKQYVYTPLNGDTRVYGVDDVVHVYGMSLDGVVGESPISRCKAAFGAAMARDEFEGGFYNRGATLSGKVTHPNRLSDDAIRHLKESVNAIYGGTGKAHQVGVFEEGADFVTVGSPLKDLEFVAAQQLSRTDIASIFKLPPNYLGGSTGDSLTYATVESNQLQFALHAIAPVTNTITSALTADPSIFPQNIYDCEFVLEGMLRADAQARAGYYKTMAEIKAITPNEIRRLENMAPIAGGDKIQADPPAPPPPSQLPVESQPVPNGQIRPPAKTNGNGVLSPRRSQ